MTTSIQEGDAIVAGYRWSLRIEMDVVAFPVGVRLVGHVRRKIGDAIKLADLSTDDGTIVRVDDTHIDIVLDGDVSAQWAAGTVVMDLVRVDTDPDRHLGFKLTVPVELPVTRGLA
jgi:hypothetical protein